MKENISAIIREKREKLGLSRMKLAKQIGIPARTIEAWEMQERKPSKATNVFRIAKALDIPIEDII